MPILKVNRHDRVRRPKQFLTRITVDSILLQYWDSTAAMLSLNSFPGTPYFLLAYCEYKPDRDSLVPAKPIFESP